MANKLSLANKYRPQTFDDIVEQDSIKVVIQNQIATNNLKHAYLFCGGAGTGKAQPLGSMVLTPTGYVKMGDVYVGQEVIDGLGNTTTITDIFPQGIKPVYRVTFSDRTSVLCSDEHLWKVGEYNKHKKCVEWKVKSIREIMKDGIRKKHSSTSTRIRYRIPTPIISCWNDEDLKIDPYVLGILLGDGCLTTGARFANTETDIIEKVNYKLNKSGFELHKVNQTNINKCDMYDIVPKDFTYSNRYNKTSFITLLKDLNLCEKSIDKHIPNEYLYSSISTRIELLQGLFDTDGCVDNKNSRGVLVFNTSSEKLSNDFAFLVRSLGGTDTIVKKKAGYKKDGLYRQCNDTFEHTIKFSNDILPFSSLKHSNKYIEPQNRAQRKIVDIEYVGEQECQCIMVASSDHTYITDNVTITHNTTSSRIIANTMNEGQAKPIELDCASHNGVDDMRMVIEECRTKPIGSKYKIIILDECHMLTVQAWNSLLKILEEPPSYVIFIFCTTDPQKILPTILSRVQRFNFQRISVEGIYNRLIYIINSENQERRLIGQAPIQYEPEAIRYIARLAKGGMRDSITTLEKCLDYNYTSLTIDIVSKVVSGNVTEGTLLTLTRYVMEKDIKNTLLYFNSIYMGGIDVSLFIKLYIEFIQNCTKYLMTSVADITILSNTTIEWLNTVAPQAGKFIEMLDSGLAIRNNYNSEDLKIIIESWLLKICRL